MDLVPLMDTPERKAFWEFVFKVARKVREERRLNGFAWEKHLVEADEKYREKDKAAGA